MRCDSFFVNHFVFIKILLHTILYHHFIYIIYLQFHLVKINSIKFLIQRRSIIQHRSFMANKDTMYQSKEYIYNTKRKSMNDLKWSLLKTNICNVNLDYTLMIGQCFNWKKLSYTSSNNNIYIGTLSSYPLLLKQSIHGIEYINLLQSITITNNYNDLGQINNDLETLLYDYFQLQHSLEPLYETWANKCNRMKIVSQYLQGVRVLRQDPWECLISFICSSNNNINRITQILDRLRYYYGNYQCSLVYDESYSKFIFNSYYCNS